MRVILLGTGAALSDPDRNHTAILITVRGRHYLIDCGHGATHQMMRAGIDPIDIDNVFFTHLHMDHIADFPFLMLSSWIFGKQTPTTVFGPAGTVDFVSHLFENGAFAKDIEARAQYPQRQKNLHVLRPQVSEYEPGVILQDDLVKVTACHVEHIPREVTPCFALRFDSVDGKSVVFSGDTAPCDRLIKLAQDCDLLIHECTFPQKAIDFRSKGRHRNLGAYQPVRSRPDRRRSARQITDRDTFRAFRYDEPSSQETSCQAHAGRAGRAGTHGGCGH